jgi:hypothetical protein
METRPPFDEAVQRFTEFLGSQGWSRSLLWLSRDRLAGHRCDYWVYRPGDLSCQGPARGWYEEAREGDWNLRIDGFAQYDGHTLAIVERGPGKSRMLNFGIVTSGVNLQVVQSSFLWSLRCVLCRIRGVSPMLLHTDMPVSAESVTVVDRR